jgi:hypothetical protein
MTEVVADNAARFAATLGARDPKLYIFRVVCPEVPVWDVLNLDRVMLMNFVFMMDARAITRLLLGFFEVVPNGFSLVCALASGDEELIREIWVHTPDEVRTRFIGSWLAAAAALQLDVPFRRLIGLATEANQDEAVELVIEHRLVEAPAQLRRHDSI